MARPRERLRQQHVDLVETGKLGLRACIRYGEKLSARRRGGTGSIEISNRTLGSIEASAEQNQINVSGRKVDRHFLDLPALPGEDGLDGLHIVSAHPHRVARRDS